MGRRPLTALRIRRLRGVDRMYLALESPVTPMHFGALVVLDGAPLCDGDGRLRSVDVRRRLEARSASLPELRRVIHRPGPLAGPPLWVEDADFRIERQVGEVASPPSPGLTDDDTLLRFVEGLIAPPLDRSLPLWRMWFITGIPERRVAVLIAVHHALADGLGAMRLGLSFLEAPLSGAGSDGDTRAAPPAAPSPPRWRDLVRDNARILLASAVGLARPTTWRAIGSTLGSFRAGWAAIRAEPRCSLNAQVGPRRRMAVLRLDAATAKRIARAHGVGVNDIVLDLAAGGVRALLSSRGEPVERLAPRAGIAVTLPPSERGDAGNHFGSYTVALPLRDSDPVARLRRIRAKRERAKRTQSVTGVTAVREMDRTLRADPIPHGPTAVHQPHGDLPARSAAPDLPAGRAGRRPDPDPAARPQRRSGVPRVVVRGPPHRHRPDRSGRVPRPRRTDERDGA